MFSEKNRTDDLLWDTNIACMHKQASLLAATSHAAEVSELKQRLDRTENELGEVIIRLQEKQGEYHLVVCSESIGTAY